MTYPPQPGQPYGQGGQAGGYPYSAVPRYPGQRYGSPPPGPQYARQPYPQPFAGYGQGFGGPPAPPQKSRTGLWITVAVVVVLVVALGITGFVAPGFFLGKQASTDGPDQLAAAIVEGISTKDKTGLTALTCTDTDKDLTRKIETIEQTSSARSTGPAKKISDTEYVATSAITVEGTATNYDSTLRKVGDKWCWKSLKVNRAHSTVLSPAPSVKPSV